MNPITELMGRVVSLHLHSAKPGAEFKTVPSIRVVEQKGIEGNPRYFGRISQNGKPGKRQVTLIEREQLAKHAALLGLRGLPPGTVRSNIEVDGLNLVALVGQNVRVGTATLYFYEPRIPCAKMDAICNGLRKLMENGNQGVLAQVVVGGTISVGDPITLVGPHKGAEITG